MKNSIRLELTEHLNDTIEYLDCKDEIHFHAFNEDYYIIGYYQAKQWLKEHDLDVFEAIGICNDFEMENFGEIQTSFDNAEKLVNHLVYWYGLELCNGLKFGRYIVSLDGKNDLWRGNNYDEAYDEFINERSKYLYKMDIILIDTFNNETLEYYDAQEDREQDYTE